MPHKLKIHLPLGFVATIMAMLIWFTPANAQIKLPTWVTGQRAKKSSATVKRVVRKKNPQPKPIAIPYKELIIQNEPIVLSGNQILEIKKVHYIMMKSITLTDNAQLIIRDSFFEQRNPSSSLAVLLKASGSARVTIVNSALEFGQAINWDFSDHSALSVDNATMPTSESLTPVWHEFSGSAEATIKRAVFHGSVADQASITVDNSPDVFLSLNLPSGTLLNEQLPRRITNFVFPGYNDRNVYFKLNITNSTASLWGLTLNPESDITIRDTGAVALTLMLAKPLTGTAVTLDDLNPMLYQDRSITYGVNPQKMFHLNLINTSVTSWAPVVGDDNTVTISNSEITEQRWHWGNAKIILDNTTAFLVRAQNNVAITAKNSKITSDAIVKDNGSITLINSKVIGKKIIEGHGQIIEQK